MEMLSTDYTRDYSLILESLRRLQLTNKEIWKDIPSLEGYYQVSNFGRVRSLDRYVNNSRGGKRFIKGKLKKTPPSARGYIRLNLYKKGKVYRFSLHRLVYSLFIGKLIEGLFIDHIDGNPSNNNLSNLRQVTPSQSSFNTRPIKGTSKYKGVSYKSDRNKWRVSIRIGNNERKHIGYFKCEVEAAEAYNEAAKKYHKEYANLNIIEEIR